MRNRQVDGVEGQSGTLPTLNPPHPKPQSREAARGSSSPELSRMDFFKPPFSFAEEVREANTPASNTSSRSLQNALEGDTARGLQARHPALRPLGALSMVGPAAGLQVGLGCPEGRGAGSRGGTSRETCYRISTHILLTVGSLMRSQLRTCCGTGGDPPRPLSPHLSTPLNCAYGGKRRVPL